MKTIFLSYSASPADYPLLYGFIGSASAQGIQVLLPDRSYVTPQRNPGPNTRSAIQASEGVIAMLLRRGEHADLVLGEVSDAYIAQKRPIAVFVEAGATFRAADWDKLAKFQPIPFDRGHLDQLQAQISAYPEGYLMWPPKEPGDMSETTKAIVGGLLVGAGIAFLAYLASNTDNGR